MDEDTKTADQLLDAVMLMMAGGSEALVGARALLREIRDRHPGEFDITAAGMQARRLNLRRPANSLAV